MSRSDQDETIQGWAEQLWAKRRWAPSDMEQIHATFIALGDEQDFPGPGQFLKEFRLQDPGSRPAQALDESKSVYYRKPRDWPFLGRVSTTIWWHPDNPHREALPSAEQRAVWEDECAYLVDSRERMGQWPAGQR